jgi:4-aminobutyrate aminotransferase-like enzyme
VKSRDTKEVLGKTEVGKIKDLLHADGMLITVSGLWGNVLRLQPPLTVTRTHIDSLIGSLRKALATVRQGG